MATAVAATVNGGVMPKPTLLARDAGTPAPGQRVFSERTSRDMRRLMRLVVEHGTGGNADVAGYRVGGKTGTANKQVGGTYQRNARISSFVGAFPMDDPRYVIFAMVDEPKGHSGSFGYATGGWVAAPVVGNVVARMAPLLGIQPRQRTITPDMDEHPLLIHTVGEDLRLAAQ
jgi:cell division protein FtsI (penicillin-binding protein 3)